MEENQSIIDLVNKCNTFLDNKNYVEAERTCKEILKIRPDNLYALQNSVYILRIEEKYQEALDHVNNLIKKYPNEISFWNEKAMIFFNQKLYEDALIYFNKSLQVVPNNEFILKWAIESNRMLRNYKEAERILNDALHYFPESVDVLQQQGWLMYNLKNYEEAIKIFDKIISIEPNNFLAKLWKVVSLRFEKQYTEAEIEAQNALIDFPDNTDLLMELAWVYYDQNKYADAINIFNQVLYIDPDNSKAKLWKITSLRKNRNFDEAKTEIDKVLINEPENVDILNELGWLYYNNNKYEDAVNIFSKVLSIDKKNNDALLWKITSLRQLKKFDLLKKEIEIALEIAPNHVEILNEVGWFYYFQKDYQKSQEIFKKVLSLDPENEYATKWRIISLRLLRQFDEAKKLLEDSKLRLPNYKELQIQEANINLDIHNYEKAIAIFNEILKLDDKNEEAYTGLILANQLAKNISETEKIIDEALSKLPYNSRVLYQTYWFYNEQGNYKKADEYISEAIKVDPNWTILYINRAEVLNKLNKNYDAIQIIQYVLDTYPEDLELHEGVGWYYLSRNQALKARNEFEFILSKQSNNVFGINGIGGSYFYQGLYNKAEDYFRQAVELDQKNPVFYNNLGWAILRQNDASKLDEAQKYANKAIELDPIYDSAIGCLGVIAFKKGNLLESEDYFLRSIQLSTSRGSYTDLGALYAQTGRYEDAEANLLKSIQFNRNDERAYIELGNLYLKQERIKDAIKQFQFSKAIAPRNSKTHNALAIALNQDGNFKEAEETLREAIRQLDSHKRAPLHLTLSNILVNMGDKLGDSQLYEEALQETNKAKRIITNKPEAYFHSGIARFKLEDYSGSIKDFKECLKLDKHNFEAERNIRRLQTLLQSERIRSRGSMLAGIVVGAISIVQIIILWVFYFLEKINENILLVMLPILLGLTVIAFLLPWLIKIKLPGIEAELSQPTKSISSGPTGEINFASSTSLINTGPQ